MSSSATDASKVFRIPRSSRYMASPGRWNDGPGPPRQPHRLMVSCQVLIVASRSAADFWKSTGYSTAVRSLGRPAASAALLGAAPGRVTSSLYLL
ncbi:hypothetical protein G6F50_018298 [Rhizopus delemar]|uniref:Uncharacterized protein n=1 Tax=Rhizopus delemar TaxID=936053 RepID=A0A9P6XN35_9FUNG|nr:hypothetical protein G6F50_018298 [Rhizopus delemar]